MRRRAGEAIYWRARNIERCKYDAPKLVVERHLWRIKSYFCCVDAPNVAVCGIIQNLNYEKR